jgi:hypothetical protein
MISVTATCGGERATRDRLRFPERMLARLLDETGSPVVAAYIADSDYGWLVGLNRAGLRGAGPEPQRSSLREA